jgi:hypothetical protein
LDAPRSGARREANANANSMRTEGPQHDESLLSGRRMLSIGRNADNRLCQMAKR